MSRGFKLRLENRRVEHENAFCYEITRLTALLKAKGTIPCLAPSFPSQQPHTLHPSPHREQSSWDWGKLRKRTAEFIIVFVLLRTKQLHQQATVVRVRDGAAGTEQMAADSRDGRAGRAAVPPAKASACSRKCLQLKGKGKSSLSL